MDFNIQGPSYSKYESRVSYEFAINNEEKNSDNIEFLVNLSDIKLTKISTDFLDEIYSKEKYSIYYEINNSEEFVLLNEFDNKEEYIDIKFENITSLKWVFNNNLFSINKIIIDGVVQKENDKLEIKASIKDISKSFTTLIEDTSVLNLESELNNLEYSVNFKANKSEIKNPILYVLLSRDFNFLNDDIIYYNYFDNKLIDFSEEEFLENINLEKEILDYKEKTLIKYKFNETIEQKGSITVDINLENKGQSNDDFYLKAFLGSENENLIIEKDYLEFDNSINLDENIKVMSIINKEKVELVNIELNKQNVENIKLNSTDRNENSLIRSNETLDESFSISGFVWVDSNQNGEKDINEEKVANVEVNLYDASNNILIKSTNTNLNGNYNFEDIDVSEYYISFSNILDEHIFIQSNALVNPNGRTENFLLSVDKIINAPIMEKIEMFKDFTIEKQIMVPCQKPDIEEILGQIISIDIKDYYLTETLSSTSYEGQIVTGYSLVVFSDINIVTEYIANHGGVHAINTNFPITTNIIVPRELVNSNFEVKGIVNDAHQYKIDDRCSVLSISILLTANNF